MTQALSEYGTTSVTLVGHSLGESSKIRGGTYAYILLGAAITLLDSVYLPLWLPPGTTFQTFCYGLPRVGNQAFADYVDANLFLTHINNKEDLIPTLPSMFLGYAHPAGEVHIRDSGEWAACPGTLFVLLFIYFLDNVHMSSRPGQPKHRVHSRRRSLHLGRQFQRSQRSLQWHHNGL